MTLHLRGRRMVGTERRWAFALRALVAVWFALLCIDVGIPSTAYTFGGSIRQKRSRCSERLVTFGASALPKDGVERTLLLRKRLVRDWRDVLFELRDGADQDEPYSAAILCGVSRGGNLGAVLRTCALLGVPLVVVLGGLSIEDLDRALWSSQFMRRPDWNIRLTAPSSELSVANGLSQLRSVGLPLLGITAHGAGTRELWDAELATERLGLVFGSERDGIPDDALPYLSASATVPMEVSGEEGSLNLSHAVTIAAYERRRQRHRQKQQQLTGIGERFATQRAVRSGGLPRQKDRSVASSSASIASGSGSGSVPVRGVRPSQSRRSGW